MAQPGTPRDDVFISYAHLDNQALTERDAGWVSAFHEALTKRLGEVWGRAPRIWRDPKLQGNDVFDSLLDERCRNAAVLVSVVTPRYVNSDWCLRELNGFWQAAEAGAGAVLEHKARIFKVLKTPTNTARLPPPVQPLLGYEFYRLQPGSGRPLEFNRVYGAEAEREFWMQLNDLAYDVADVLQRLECASSAPQPARAAVYLATTTADLQPLRDALRRELLRLGWRVHPLTTLPLDSAALAPAVAEQMAGCAVSVHLAGAVAGLVPEGGEESVPALQARLAGERAGCGALVRLVWLAPGNAAAEGRQQAWLAALRDDPAPGPGSDLLETGFDALQQLVLQRLQAAQAALDAERAAQAKTQVRATAQAAAAALALPSAAAPARIYLVCTPEDLAAVMPLRAHLFDQGFEAVLPVFDGDEAALRRAHEAELRDCDGLLLYYGAGSEFWLREKLAELRRLPALPRATPLRASGICVAPPTTPAKQLLLTREALLLAMPQGFDPAALAPFNQALQARS